MKVILLNGSQEDRSSNLKKTFGSLRNQKKGLHNYKDKEHLFDPFVSEFHPSQGFIEILHEMYEEICGAPMASTALEKEKEKEKGQGTDQENNEMDNDENNGNDGGGGNDDDDDANAGDKDNKNKQKNKNNKNKKNKKKRIEILDRDEVENWSAEDYDIVYPYDEQFEHEMNAEDDWIDDRDIQKMNLTQNNGSELSKDKEEKEEKEEEDDDDEKDTELNNGHETKQLSQKSLKGKEQEKEKTSKKAFAFGNEENEEEEFENEEEREERASMKFVFSLDDAEAAANEEEEEELQAPNQARRSSVSLDIEKEEEEEEEEKEEKELKEEKHSDTDNESHHNHDNHSDNHSVKKEEKKKKDKLALKFVESLAVDKEWNNKPINEMNAYQIMREIEVEIIYFAHKYMDLEKIENDNHDHNHNHDHGHDHDHDHDHDDDHFSETASVKLTSDYKESHKKEKKDITHELNLNTKGCELVESKTLEQLEEEKRKAKEEEMLKINENTAEMFRLPRIMRHGHIHHRHDPNDPNNPEIEYCFSSGGSSDGSASDNGGIGGNGGHGHNHDHDHDHDHHHDHDHDPTEKIQGSDNEWYESDDIDYWLPEDMKHSQDHKKKKQRLQFKRRMKLKKQKLKRLKVWNKNNRMGARQMIDNVIYTSSEYESDHNQDQNQNQNQTQNQTQNQNQNQNQAQNHNHNRHHKSQYDWSSDSISDHERDLDQKQSKLFQKDEEKQIQIKKQKTNTYFMKVAIAPGSNYCVHVRVYWDGHLAHLQNIAFNKTRSHKLKIMKNLFRNRVVHNDDQHRTQNPNSIYR